ncbi:molybdopterin-dependent oxidoreductase [Myxococcota bacterium]
MMPTFELDGQRLPFEPGDTIIQAARRAGIDIPHYCWHPGLSVAANCRMCLVELVPSPGRPAVSLDVLHWDTQENRYIPSKKPKLVPACLHQVTDGLMVKSQLSEHVKRARAAVQELLLLNHPVDCPICDQAGECRLQDYWLEYQGTGKRMRDEIVHKPKAVTFGPTLVYDAERCIVCTRCVRLCEELAQDPVLSIRERGNLSQIVLAPGRQLDHPYSLMTEQVCPVGALTAVDFRFKARVWFLRSARTICIGCATGCNAFLDYDPRTGQVFRHRPRENPAVNSYWMCDEGMLSYRRVHHHRCLQARANGGPVTFPEALALAATRLKRTQRGELAVVLSAQHSLEDNRALLEFSHERFGVAQTLIAGHPAGEGDTVLRTQGVSSLLEGLAPQSFSEFGEAVTKRQITRVLVLGGDLPDPALLAICQRLKLLVVLASHHGPLLDRAHVVLPVSTWAESEGTFVNARGMAQRSERAIPPLGASQPAWKVIQMLAQALDADPLQTHRRGVA